MENFSNQINEISHNLEVLERDMSTSEVNLKDIEAKIDGEC